MQSMYNTLERQPAPWRAAGRCCSYYPLYYILQLLSIVNLHKFEGLSILKFVHFFCAIAIDFVQRLWYYNYSKREVVRPSNEVSDAVGKSQRTTRKNQKS